MVINGRTRRKVALALQERAVGRGITVAQLRRAYPAKDVRRTSLLEAIAELEAMRLVEWNGRRVRWASAHYDVERVLGERVDRIERDRRRAVTDRVVRAATLSSAVRRAVP